MTYEIQPARYAKGKMIVRPLDSFDGMKGRASYLIEALGGRYVHRSHGYVVSPSAAEKFKKLYDAGFTAELRMFFDDRRKNIIAHDDRGLSRLTVAEALKAA